MNIEDRVLRELHRAASEAGRPGIAVPSTDLERAAQRVGSRSIAGEALHRLVRAGRVVRVRRDLLVLPDVAGLLRVELADLIHAAAPHPYLITGGAAFEHAGLSDQHSFGVAVLVPADVRALRYRGQTARFFTADADSIWGWDPGEPRRYAMPERAILDAVNHPRFGVSLAHALAVIQRAGGRDRTFLNRLLRAVERYGAGARGHGSRACARRVGLIIDRLYGEAAAAPYRELIGSNRSPTPLRPGGPRTDLIDPTWRVAINAPIEPELAW